MLDVVSGLPALTIYVTAFEKIQTATLLLLLFCTHCSVDQLAAGCIPLTGLLTRKPRKESTHITLVSACLPHKHCLQARKNLEYVRGRKDVDKEFNGLVEAGRIAAQCKNPWGTLFSRKYWPQLILSACSTTFQQWTG